MCITPEDSLLFLLGSHWEWINSGRTNVYDVEIFVCVFVFNPHPRICLLIWGGERKRKRERERERERERDIYVREKHPSVASYTCLDRDWTYNLLVYETQQSHWPGQMFLILLLLMVFFCLSALANTTNTGLNSSGNSGHRCGAPDLWWFSN